MRGFRRWLRAEWDHVVGYGCIGLGGVFLVVGIQGVRHSGDVVDELAYLASGGLGGMYVLGVGATLLLSADLRDDWRKLQRVEERLERVEQLLLERPTGEVLAGVAAEVTVARPERLPDPAPTLRMARRFSLSGLAVAGAVFLTGWWMVAYQPGPLNISAGFSLSLGAVLLAALCAALTTARLKGALEARKVAVLGPWMAGSGPPGPSPGSRSGAQVWIVDGLHRYHRPGCLALAGRPGREVEHRDIPTDSSSCGLCEPA